MLNYSNELDRLLMIAEAICEVPGLNEGSDKLRAEKQQHSIPLQARLCAIFRKASEKTL